MRSPHTGTFASAIDAIARHRAELAGVLHALAITMAAAIDTLVARTASK